MEILRGLFGNRKEKRDKNGNLVIGQGNQVEAPDGVVQDTTIVGQDNVVKSSAKAGNRVEIKGNRMFGKGNRIVVSSGDEED